MVDARMETSFWPNKFWASWDFPAAYVSITSTGEATNIDSWAPMAELKCELQKLLGSEEEKATEDVTERNLDSEMKLPGFAEAIDAIGKEVDKLMIDSLLAEIAYMSMKQNHFR